MTFCYATITVMVGASQTYGYSVSKKSNYENQRFLDSFREESSDGGCHIGEG